jgi:hypothetical protein
MKGTAAVPDAIAGTRLPETAVNAFNAHAAARDAPIRRFGRPCAILSSRFLDRHDDFHRVERERQEAQSSEQAAACGQWVRVAPAIRVSRVLPA